MIERTVEAYTLILKKSDIDLLWNLINSDGVQVAAKNAKAVADLYEALKKAAAHVSSYNEPRRIEPSV